MWGMRRTRRRIQYNIVRVDGQKSVYLPILKQGGNSNTIQIVNGVRKRIKNLLDVPKSWWPPWSSTSRST